MPRSVTIEFGRCGWGVEKGPPQILRLGCVAIMVLRQSVMTALRESNDKLAHARNALRQMLAVRGPSR